MIKHVIKVQVIWLMFLSITFNSSAAFAGSISAQNEVLIDWTSLTFSGIAISWQSQGSASTVEVYDPTGSIMDEDRQTGWVDTLVTESVNSTTGFAWTTETELYKEGYAELGTDSVNGDKAAALTSASRFGEFLALDSGVLEISMDYFFALAASTDTVGQWASTSAFAAVFLENVTSDISAFDDATFSKIVRDGQSGSLTDSGTLSVMLEFNAGDAGVFDTGVCGNPTVVVVPEPSSIISFFIGLLLLGLIQCRRKQKISG